MKLITIIFLLISISNDSFAQKDANNILHRVNSISSKDTSSFSDLAFLEDVLKDKRVVFLGEGTHEDALTLEAKVRITKYLHEKLDYDVLLLEYGFTEVDRMWRDIKEGKDSVTGAFAWLTEFFPMYINEPYQNLAFYVQSKLNTPDELYIGGIDPFESTIYSNAFASELEAVLAKNCANFFEMPIYEDFRKFTRKGELKMIKSKRDMKRKYKGIDIENFRTWAKRLDLFIDSILQNKDLEEIEKKELQIFQQGIVSRLGLLDWNINKKIKKYKSEIEYGSYTRIRDVYMAKNILWYIDEFFPDKKIIVSASSLHLSRELNRIKEAEKQMGELTTAGEITYELHRDDLYSIAFINYNGAGGFFLADTVTFKSSEKPQNSLEHYLHNKGEKYCFLDLMDAKKHIPLCATKYIMHPTFEIPHAANWENMYDGIFYIDKMKPLKTFSYTNRIAKKQPYDLHPDWFIDFIPEQTD